MGPIIHKLAQDARVEHRLIATGQQGALLDQAAAGIGLVIDQRLGAFSGAADMIGQMTGMESALSRAFESPKPDLVLVHGDTNSALAAARAAHGLGIAVGHVEAGLRTHIPDRPWPEEQNRLAIARLATLHFAPSALAAENLIAERVGGTIYVTGNTGIDILIAHRPEHWRKRPRSVLVTCHRRENFGAPLVRICTALLHLATYHDVRFTVPLHPNPNARSTIVALLSGHDGIQLVEPLPYPALLQAAADSMVVLSDSGGLQEECAALGVPLLLMREETERPEVIVSGNCILVGSDRDAIVSQLCRLLDDAPHYAAMSRPCWPYGNGDASAKIADAIQTWHSQQKGVHRLSIARKM